MSETIIVTPTVYNLTVSSTVPTIQITAPGPQGATGASGVANATSPLAYNSGTQTISLTYTNLVINGGNA